MGERASRMKTSDRFDDVRVSGSFMTPDSTKPRPAPSSSSTASENEPAAIESEIEQTRAEMTETIEAIQERFDPETLTDQAKDTAHVVVDHAIQEAKAAVRELTSQAKDQIRGATIGKVEQMASTTSEATKGFGTAALTTIRQNPGPAALTALGIGWLVANGPSSGNGKPQASESATGAPAGAALSQVQAQAMAGDVKGQVQDTAGNVATQVQETANSVGGQVQQKASQFSNQLLQAPSWLSQKVAENPLPLGAAAIVVGSLAALALPGSQRENQLLGQARDSVVDQAQTSAGQVVDKVQHVAGEAQEAVEKEAKYQGLASG